MGTPRVPKRWAYRIRHANQRYGGPSWAIRERGREDISSISGRVERRCELLEQEFFRCETMKRLNVETAPGTSSENSRSYADFWILEVQFERILVDSAKRVCTGTTRHCQARTNSTTEIGAT